MSLPELHTCERRYDEAIPAHKKIIAFDRSFPWSYGKLVDVYEKKQMYAEALDAMQQGSALKGEPEMAREARKAYADSGYSGLLHMELAAGLQEREQGKYNNPVAIAGVYALLGDQE